MCLDRTVKQNRNNRRKQGHTGNLTRWNTFVNVHFDIYIYISFSLQSGQLGNVTTTKVVGQGEMEGDLY